MKYRHPKQNLNLDCDIKAACLVFNMKQACTGLMEQRRSFLPLSEELTSKRFPKMISQIQ